MEILFENGSILRLEQHTDSVSDESYTMLVIVPNEARLLDGEREQYITLGDHEVAKMVDPLIDWLVMKA